METKVKCIASLSFDESLLHLVRNGQKKKSDGRPPGTWMGGGCKMEMGEGRGGEKCPFPPPPPTLFSAEIDWPTAAQARGGLTGGGTRRCFFFWGGAFARSARVEGRKGPWTTKWEKRKLFFYIKNPLSRSEVLRGK